MSVLSLLGSFFGKKDAQNNPVGLVQQLVKEVTAEMSPTWARWERYRLKKRNKWYLETMTKRLYSTNYLATKVEAIKANMALQLPWPECQGVEGSDRSIAQALTTLLTWELYNCGWKKVIRQVVDEGETVGIGWLKPWLDPNKFDGEGGNVIDVCAGDEVLVDRKARTVEEIRFAIHKQENADVAALEREFKKKIVPSEEDQKHWKDGNAPTVTRYEAFLKTPEGWQVIRVAGSTLLKPPEPLPYAHGRLPLIPYFATDERTLYPPGTVELIEPLQDLADALDEQIYRNIRLTVNRQRTVLAGAGVEPHQLNNIPGHSYKVTTHEAIKWDSPPPLPAEIFAYRNEIENRIDMVSGVHRPVEGGTPGGGVTAWGAIAALQDFSTRRIQMKLEILADAATEVARQLLSNIKQYYGPYRVIRVAGGKNFTILDEYPPELGFNEETPIEAKAQWREQNGIDLVLSDVDERYDVIVNADTALPPSRAQRAQTALQLFNLRDQNGVPVIDDEALLEALDWPSRQQIINRKRQGIQATQAQVQQMIGGVTNQEALQSMMSGGQMTPPERMPVI